MFRFEKSLKTMFTTRASLRDLLSFLLRRLKVRSIFVRALRRHVSIQSARDYTFPQKNVRVDYKSEILAITAEEYLGIYSLRDIVVHSPTGLGFFKPKSYEETLIAETSKDITNFFIHNSSKTDSSNLFDFDREDVKSIRGEKPTVLFFTRRPKTPGGFHSFAVFDLCPLLLLLDNWGGDVRILYQNNLLGYQREYLDIVRRYYPVELIEAPEESHVRIAGPVLFMEPPIKRYFRSFELGARIKDAEVWNYSRRPERGLPSDVDFFSDVSFVSINPPANISSKPKEWVWGRYTKIKRMPANTATDGLSSLSKKVLADNSSEPAALGGRILYISRKANNPRSLHNEQEMLERFPEIMLIQWEQYSQVEKMRLAFGAEVLIGVHGAGLTAGYFMQPGRVVIELHPRFFRYPELRATYKTMCEACNLRYIGVVSSSISDKGTELDLDILARALRTAELHLSSEITTEGS